jgi:GT2 family glycosyltransferase
VDSKPLVDICVLTIGRFNLLKKCLDHLQADLELSKVKANVYLLENGTDAGSGFDHPVITKKRRIAPMKGFPGGANTVIAMGTAPLVWFVTDDIFVKQGALLALLEIMENDQKISICGLKLVFPSDSTEAHRPAGKVQHVGHAMTVRGNIVHPLVGWDANHPKCCVSREVFSVTGATFMVRRKAFEKVGGFDVQYGNGTYEDVDLCLKLRRLGGKIYICTDAMAEHIVGGSVTKERSFPLRQNEQIFRARWQSTGAFQIDDVMFY